MSYLQGPPRGLPRGESRGRNTIANVAYIVISAFGKIPDIAITGVITPVIAFCVGEDLFSRAVSSQVSSALMSLTSVFGMGTGGSSP